MDRPQAPAPARTLARLEDTHDLEPVMSAVSKNGRALILIAERDRNVRELQLYFLNNAGFAVEFADDGQCALDRARLHAPALLITEILIPKIDGLTLCRLVRNDPSLADVPVIVFSILAASTRANDAGAAAFLRKPLVESTFLAAINGVMMNTNAIVDAP